MRPAKKSSFDWAYLYYLAKNKLGFTEEEFWDSSIEKINDLVSVHGAFNDKKLAKKRENDLARKDSDSKGTVYIDETGIF